MKPAKGFVNRERNFQYHIYDTGCICANNISERMRRKLNSLCDIQGIDIPTQQILFLYDERPYTGGPISCVVQLSKMTKELLYQVTGCLFTVAIRMNRAASKQLREAPLSNEIYHCLRHMRLNEKTGELEVTKHHGVEQWEEQMTFADGISFAEDSPNLFDERIFPADEPAPQEEAQTEAQPEADDAPAEAETPPAQAAVEAA